MKKAINLWYLLLPVLLFMVSCKKSSLPSEYLEALKENKGLNKTVTIGDVDYTFRIQTPEAMALKSATDDSRSTDTAKYRQRLAELKGNLYVNIEMQLHNKDASILKYKLSDQREYQQRVMYYEFYAKDDLRVICNGKEMPPLSYQYENHLDMMPYNTMVIAFPLCREENNFQVVFNDRAFNNLFIKANFSIEDINSLPNLTLN